MRFKILKASVIAIAAISAIPMISLAQLKHATQTNYPEYTGLVMAGYQGWFRAAGDGSSSKRFAYGDEKRSGIDMWPDVSEYTKTY
ncbi:MAG: xylosidase, partial [Chitinophagaceae bacterium]